jgi:hypothetical protein
MGELRATIRSRLFLNLYYDIISRIISRVTGVNGSNMLHDRRPAIKTGSNRSSGKVGEISSEWTDHPAQKLGGRVEHFGPVTDEKYKLWRWKDISE